MNSNLHETTAAGAMLLCAMAAVIVVAYFLGTIIGFHRDVRAKWALLVFNTILGVTMIGWLVSLVWGLSGATRAEDKFFRSQRGR